MKEFLKTKNLKKKERKKINGCSYLQTSRYTALLWIGYVQGTGIYSSGILFEKRVISEASLKRSISKTHIPLLDVISPVHWWIK